MKKNKMMRIASALLVAVLLTTCAISGTFAKYTTKVTSTATANVAQWSFELNDVAIADDFTFSLFDTIVDTYDAGANTHGAGETKVAAGHIAPGTKGSFQIKLENTSEVVAKYTVTLSDTSATPITFTIENASAELAIGASATVTVNWVWNYESGNDAADMAFAENFATYAVTATVDVTQVD